MTAGYEPNELDLCERFEKGTANNGTAKAKEIIMYTNTAATRLNNGRRRNTLHCKRIGETTKEAKDTGKTVALEATSNKETGTARKVLRRARGRVRRRRREREQRKKEKETKLTQRQNQMKVLKQQK